MTGRRKILYWVSGIAGGILLLLCLAILLAPLFLNLESIQQDILARFNRETGGRGAFTKIEISFFPRPHAAVYEGSLSTKNQKIFSFEKMVVYPELLSLFRGRFLPARIQLSAPRLNISLPPRENDGPPRSFLPSTKGKPILSPEVKAWIDKMVGLVIQVQNGRVNLAVRKGSDFHFEDVDLTAERTRGSLDFQLTCASHLFQRMTLKAQTDVPSYQTKGTLVLTGFNGGNLPEGFRHHRSFKLLQGLLDLQMDFEGQGLESLKASGSLTAPNLTFSRGPRKTTLKDVRLSGNIAIDGETVNASLSHLILAHPALRLSGNFRKEQADPPLSIHLKGEKVNVPALRSCALDLAGDISTVSDIFDIVKGGTVSSLSVDFNGKTFEDLSNLDGYTIQGIMREGRISLVNPKMNLTDVTGSALIAKGILSGRRLRAGFGNITGKEGILTVPLEVGVAPFHLDIQLDAELTEAFSVLKTLIPKGPFHEQLGRMGSIEGRAVARLRLNAPENKDKPLRVGVDCASLNLKGVYQSPYQRRPIPITVLRGQVHYRQDRIQIEALEGSCGDSEFFVARGGLNWENDPVLEIASAKGSILLDQAYPLISTLIRRGKPWKGPRTLKGLLLIHSMDFKGPLEKPAAWRYHADSEILNLFLKTDVLPGVLRAPEARLKIDPREIRVEDGRIEVLDALLNMESAVFGPLKGPRRFETTFTGTLGAEAVKHLHHALSLPGDLLLRTPLNIRTGHFSWMKDQAVTFSGKMDFPDGPSVSADVSYGAGKLNIRQLVVEENDERASLGMLAHKDLVNFNFSGRLNKSALDGIFCRNPLLDGFVEGEISARILPTQSFATSAEGFLRGNHIPVYGLALPAKIEAFSLRARGRLLHLDSMGLRLNRNRLTVSGNADLSTEDPRFDVDISTDTVDLDKILAYLKKTDDQRDGSKRRDPWRFPVRGTAHLMWDRLKIGGFTWEPFQGEVGFESDGIRVAVENAKFCGIASTGFLRIKQDHAELDFRLRAEKNQLNRCITCLTHERVIADGTFDLSSHVSARGNWKNLPTELKGPILFAATDGKIKHDPALGRVISVLSVTDIFKGKLPTFGTDGFSYDRVQIRGNFKNGKIQLEQGLMNSSAMHLAFSGDVDPLNEQLDIKMLASPFTLMNRAIRLLPVVGYIMGGTLISVPVEVKGPLKDPEVKILPFSGIGSGIWGMMKRTLETPFKIVEPLVGEKEASKNKDDESVFW